jgi:hypothetical protein
MPHSEERTFGELEIYRPDSISSIQSFPPSTFCFHHPEANLK